MWQITEALWQTRMLIHQLRSHQPKPTDWETCVKQVAGLPLHKGDGFLHFGSYCQSSCSNLGREDDLYGQWLFKSFNEFI